VPFKLTTCSKSDVDQFLSKTSPNAAKLFLAPVQDAITPSIVPEILKVLKFIVFKHLKQLFETKSGTHGASLRHLTGDYKNVLIFN